MNDLKQDMIERAEAEDWYNKLVSLPRSEEDYNKYLATDFSILLNHLTSPNAPTSKLQGPILNNEVARACVKVMYLFQPSFRIRWDLAYGPLEVEKVNG